MDLRAGGRLRAILCATLLVGASSESLAFATTVPTGLNPWDEYRLVFVSSTKRDATSSDIADYNAFVTALADAVPELLALGATWTAIASTSTVDARDNTNTNPGTAVGVPIYLLDGTLLVIDNADLWDGALPAPLNVDETGSPNDEGLGSIVWTGTDPDGTATTPGALGDSVCMLGHYLATDGPEWIALANGFDQDNLFRVYAISSTLTVPGAPTGTPSFRDLGDLPGGALSSRAARASSDGRTVVGRSESAAGTEAFRWTAGRNMVGMGDLSGGSFGSRARAVSARGGVVAGQGNSGSGPEAFRWTQVGGMVGLGDLPGGTFDSNGYGISGDGLVVVGQGKSGSGFEAFRWTALGGMVGLGDLPGGSFISVALDVSSDGSVVAGIGQAVAGREAFRWTDAGGMVGLGDLAGGAVESLAQAISDDGAVIVGVGQGASGQEAFRWTSSGGMAGLGDLAGGLFGSGARDVSANGLTVVGYGSGPAGLEAMIWDSAFGMRSLYDELVDVWGLDLTGWTLDVATGISDDGRTIVGYGSSPTGQTKAWIATLDGFSQVPALSVVAELALFVGLAATGALLLLRRRQLLERRQDPQEDGIHG